MFKNYTVMILALWLMMSVQSCPTECRCDNRNRVYCNNRDLTKIPSKIPVHTKILYLQDNELTSTTQLERELGHLTYLERLMLYNNRLDTFPKLRSKYLRELRINKNRITGISSNALSEVPNLSNLILDENELTNGGIEPGAFQHLASLKHVSLNRNKFTQFPSGFSNSLQQIFLTDNEISYIPHTSISNLTNLEKLFVNRNKLSDGSIENDAFGGLSALVEVELSNNYLTHLPGKITNSVEKIYMRSNQMEFMRKMELNNLLNLRTLDIAYNRLRAVEKGAFDQLESLLQLDLSGNNWNCDCHLKPIKNYLSKNPVHYEQLTCGDPKHTGITVDTIHEDAFTCNAINFNLTQTNSAVLIRSDVSDDILPPFADFRLRTEEIHSAIGILVDEVAVDLPAEVPLTKLKAEKLYRVCLYNAYIWDTTAIPEEFCTNFKTNHVEQNASHVSTEVIVGIIIGFILMFSIIAAFFIAKRSKIILKFLPFSSKLHTPGENHDVEPSRLGRPYSSKLALYSQHGTTNKYSNQPDLTLDASKEFNVTLMLRAPDGQPHQQQHQKQSPPPPYDGKNGKNKQRAHSFTSSSLGSEETNKTLLSSRHDLGIYL